MKVYLVGGAVRDKLLDIPVKERDWVVVGATPETLLSKNFKQVGRDFPVFLHPETNEEYALARTERKTGSGYYGFDCITNASVTLEEDLARRDLTINAIAMDENGNLIDPYKGRLDLKNKVLRHVSPAFVEDPVRVLRVARFAARFYSLGFRLANETRLLMYSMVQGGELAHLVPERVWQEWQRSLQENNPEQFILTLRSCDALKIILPELNDLFGIPNPAQYHHEIDSGVHTVLVLQAACALSTNPIVRFAALVHDLGKALSPMSSWPKHHGHEDKGVAIIDSLCARLRIPNEYRSLAKLVSKQHLNIHRLSVLRAQTILNILEQSDAFRRPQQFYNLLIACQADAEGCGKKIHYIPSKLWQNIHMECSNIDSKIIIDQGYEGKAIKEALHQRRLACIKQIVDSWNLNEK